MFDSSNYYLIHKIRFMLEFDLVARSARSVASRSGGEAANVLITDACHEFEKLIP